MTKVRDVVIVEIDSANDDYQALYCDGRLVMVDTEIDASQIAGLCHDCFLTVKMLFVASFEGDFPSNLKDLPGLSEAVYWKSLSDSELEEYQANFKD
jgi:hypothetical protein